MSKDQLNKAFLLFIIFCTPIYLLKVTLFSIPFNFLELLIIPFIIYNLIADKKIINNFLKLPRSITISILLLIVGILFSIILNKNFTSGFGILKSWFIIPIFFAFITYSLSNSLNDIKKILLSINYSATLVATISLIYKALGIVTYDDRLTSIYSSPNYLAMYLSSGVFLNIYFLKESFLQNKFSKKTLFYLSTLLVIMFSIYFTYSYGAWLALITAFSITIFSTIKNKRGLVLSLIFFTIFTVVLFLAQFSSEKFYNITQNYSRSSISSRLMIWESSKLMLKQSPIFGIGAGNFQNKYLELQSHFPPYLEWGVPQPHNIFLAFWLQTGLIGLIGFCWILLYVFKIIFLLLKNKKSIAIATPIFCFFLYIVLHGLVDTTYWKNDLSLIFWIYFFITLSLARIYQKET
jgi:O-antigen ligase